MSDSAVHLQPSQHFMVAKPDVRGWVGTILVPLILLILIAAAVALGVPGMFSVTPIVTAAAILGVSIVLTGVLVPCVVAVLARRKAVANMLDDVTEIERQLTRGETDAAAIRQFTRARRHRVSY